MRFLVFLSVLGFALVTAPVARAVPPPDFIFSITSQAGPAFALIVFALSAFFGAVRQALAPYVAVIRQKKWLVVPAAVLIVGTGVAGAIRFDQWRQDQAYQTWLAGSAVYTDFGAAEDTTNAVDLLSANDVPVTDVSPSEDAGAQFVRSYYTAIGSGRLSEAYAVSKKSVPYETFRSWYAQTTDVTVDSLQPVGDGRYSLALTLTDAGETTRYAVLMTTARDEAGVYRVVASEVRIITSLGSSAGAPEGGATPAATDLVSMPLAISNAAFDAVRSDSATFVLDAREDEENAYGRFPGSTHIRFADLIAGDWIQLPTDRTIYVLCWSGMRGKEVAEFLRGKGIAARYLENGANGWVAAGGTWEGEINFLNVYTEERYRIVFSKREVERLVAEGAVLVDSRPTTAFDAWHIPGSFSLPLIYTPTAKIAEVIAAIPAGTRVITVCDDFTSCFDAKMGGVKLENAGHEFLGRFATPWDFQ